ncbi:MAG TPA: flagellar hook-basal body complex protein FliE [Actinomycetales bacterium]|nr:flagellar hook-basal body complex protein FliE [Actinomycetales bacterium]
MSGIAGVAGVSGVAGPGAVHAAVAAARAAGPEPASAASATGAVGSGSFAAALANGLQNVEALQHNADNLAVQAATGDLTDVHDYMIAATQAKVATELTVAVRNKAIEAFQEIMRLQA